MKTSFLAIALAKVARYLNASPIFLIGSAALLHPLVLLIIDLFILLTILDGSFFFTVALRPLKALVYALSADVIALILAISCLEARACDRLTTFLPLVDGDLDGVDFLVLPKIVLSHQELNPFHADWKLFSALLPAPFQSPFLM